MTLPLARPSETRRVTVLGSTGSIGTNTLDVIDGAGEGAFEVEALTAYGNVDLLIEQCRAFRPRFAAIGDPALGAALADGVAGLGVKTGAGAEALIDAAGRDADFVMASIVGAAGLQPTLAAAERGADIGLANKECLVCAGDLVTEAVQSGGGRLLPVDSEHNAIFQVFDFDAPERVDKLILTASGGPFREASLAEMEAAGPDEAMAHPNWSMGRKISVDSATMMNKGLEFIEAARLFPVAPEQIEVLVHPQSVIHSMVEYKDGSVLAQLGAPDMRTPIAYALAWPDRIETRADRLNLADIGTLTFEAPDEVRFPALALAREALAGGDLGTAGLNAANEEAVEAFLNGKLKFLDIARVSEQVLGKILEGASSPEARKLRDLQDVVSADRKARDLANEAIAALSA